jgi:hypothetical protein
MVEEGTMRRSVAVAIALTVALLLLGFILGACVSLTPQQEQKLDEIQRFADRATAVCGKPSLRISIQRATNPTLAPSTGRAISS